MEPGTKVQWTHVSQRGRQVSMTLREGTIEFINDDVATIKTPSGKLINIYTSNLRLVGQPSRIEEIVRAMRAEYYG